MSSLAPSFWPLCSSSALSQPCRSLVVSWSLRWSAASWSYTSLLAFGCRSKRATHHRGATMEVHTSAKSLSLSRNKMSRSVNWGLYQCKRFEAGCKSLNIEGGRQLIILQQLHLCCPESFQASGRRVPRLALSCGLPNALARHVTRSICFTTMTAALTAPRCLLQSAVSSSTISQFLHQHSSHPERTRRSAMTDIVRLVLINEPSQADYNLPL